MTAHSTTQQPLSFSVMSFNLRFGLADDGPYSWENRKRAYPELFIQFQPDFIGFQEANDFQVEFLTDLLPDYRMIGIRPLAPNRWQHNIILHKKSWRCIKSGHFYLSETPIVESKFKKSKWPRQCAIGHFQNNGNDLIVANTHFDFLSEVQEKSVSVIFSLLAEFPGTIPVVITGDFNAQPGSPAHTRFMANGFKDGFEGNHAATYHNFGRNPNGQHIDWILYKGDLKIDDSAIIKLKFSEIYPSDHYPVLCRFSVF